MKKKIVVALFFLINIISLFSDDFNNYNYIKSISYPSIEGSVHERELISYLESFCRDQNLPYKISNIENTRSVNFEINLFNENKNSDNIIVITTLNSRVKEQVFYDNSISIQIMLDLIKNFKDKNNNKNITFLFSGANTREFDYNFYGLRSFISTRTDFDNSFVVFLDIISANEKIKFTGTITKKPIPLILIKKMLSLTKNSPFFYIDDKEITKSRLTELNPDSYSRFLLTNGIPTVSFSNYGNINYSPFYQNNEYKDNLSSFFKEWITSLDGEDFPMDFDYNYYPLKIFGKQFFIPEYMSIIIFLLFCFIFIFLRTFMKIFDRARVFDLIKYFPFVLVTPIIFFAVSFIPFFLSKMLGNTTIVSINSVLQFPALYFSSVFMIAILAIKIFYIKSSPIINATRQTFILTNYAIIFSLFNLLITLVIDISFMYVYLWALFFIILGHNARKIIVKISFFIVSSFMFFYILSSFSVVIREKVILEDVLNYLYLEQILLAILSTPFVILVMVSLSLVRISFKLATNIKFYAISILVVLVLTTYMIKLLPDLFPLEPVIFTQIIADNKKSESTLDIFSNKMIRDLNVRVSNQVYDINKRYESNITIPTKIEKPFSYRIEREHDKNYTTHRILVNSTTLIDEAKLYLTLPRGAHPLSSNLDFDLLEDSSVEYDENEGNIYKFFIPRFVGKELFFEVVLPNNIKNASLVFNFLYQYNVSKDVIFSYNNFIYKKSLFIEELKL